MSDAMRLIGLLLVVGPVLGAIPIANPALIPIWSAPRETHLAIVGAHRRAWAVLNAGFALATIATAAGLALLAATAGTSLVRTAGLATAAVAYTVGGGLWCAALAMRSRTTPALADLVAEDRPTEPAETLVGAAIGGLFGAFVLITGASLVLLGVTLALGGAVAAVVGWAAAGGAALLVALHLRTGDTIPALLYLPTMAVGTALVAGWT